MELDLTEDQQLVRETATRFIAERNPAERVREAIEKGIRLDAADLARRAELGWYATFVSEAFGGGSVSGVPMADAAILAEVRGAALQQDPFVEVNGAAAVLQAYGSEAQRAALLPGIVSGTSLTAQVASGDGTWGGVARAVPGPSEWHLTARSLLLPDCAEVEHILVVATDEATGRERYFVVPLDAPGVDVSGLETLDPTQPLVAVTLSDVVVPRSAVVGTSGAVTYGRSVATALAVAETVGAMTQLLTMTCEYASQRVAFGRPIGSFQALKHLLADLSVVQESAEGVSAAATRSASSPTDHTAEVVSLAKLHLGERAVSFAQDCLQVFGGIGFTWEHDLHLYMRRLTASAALHGTTTFHRECVRAHHTDQLEAGE
ncbi:acyl-CoA dehydrogenase family protein [Pseudonocardia xishanensis]|uniref:Acyl-CoA dehydrogenase family protein n=1 Tax=Pseudonocardia xishanensis TaxID=630995 RepID=A0ABP8RU84_9PSEU